MIETRVIPVLLLQNKALVKGINFKNHRYIGDPINAVKIFNQKKVDELIFLDISATSDDCEPDYDLINNIAGEAFMPLGYGGGIKKIHHIEKLFSLGLEKVILNTQAFLNPQLLKDAVKIVGSQSIVVSIDVKKSFFKGYEVFINNGKKKTGINLVEYLKKLEDLGVGELIISSIERDGLKNGYDLNLLKLVTSSVNIPVIGLGGVGKLQDFYEAKKKTNISGLAAGSLFVFYGKHDAVLITYPSNQELKKLHNY